MVLPAVVEWRASIHEVYYFSEASVARQSLLHAIRACIPWPKQV